MLNLCTNVAHYPPNPSSAPAPMNVYRGKQPPLNPTRTRTGAGTLEVPDRDKSDANLDCAWFTEQLRPQRWKRLRMNGPRPDAHKVASRQFGTGFTSPLQTLLPLHFNFCRTTLKNDISGNAASCNVVFDLRMATTAPVFKRTDSRPSTLR